MTNNTYVRKDSSGQIAAHECGHVVALAAAGLADEFLSVTIVPQNGVLGLTLRSGESIARLSARLTEYSTNLANGQPGALGTFHSFVLKEVSAICLPHLCFFLGGGSFDRLLGREDLGRNRIDAECIRRMVVPAMLLPSLSDEDLTWLQEKVDAFLFSVFNREKALFDKIYKDIVEHKTLSRDKIDPEVLKEMEACAERSKENYAQLLELVKDWYSEKVDQLSYFQVLRQHPQPGLDA